VTSHYQRHLGRAFIDEEVARNYRYRQPYPPEVFDVLAGLLVAPRTVLDAGCGSGALTRGLAGFTERIDAVDPSEAMIREGRRLPGGDSERIRWIVGRAEDAPLAAPYGLATTGASIHWMDLSVVLPRFGAALAPTGRLAIVDTESVYADEVWRRDLVAVFERYSPAHSDDFYGLIAELEASGHFTREGERRTAPIPYEQSLDDYLAMLASTSSLSRVTLRDRADAFEHDARGIFAAHGMERVRAALVAHIVWGRPR